MSRSFCRLPKVTSVHAQSAFQKQGGGGSLGPRSRHTHPVPPKQTLPPCGPSLGNLPADSPSNASLAHSHLGNWCHSGCRLGKDQPSFFPWGGVGGDQAERDGASPLPKADSSKTPQTAIPPMPTCAVPSSSSSFSSSSSSSSCKTRSK